MRTLLRALAVGLFALPLLLGTGAQASTRPRHGHPSSTVRVEGAVASPAAFSRDELAALPQTTLSDQRPGAGGHALTGVLLETLVDDAQPQLPDVKNAALRVTATVQGQGLGVTAAWGELDAKFGNHPALLVLTRDGHAVRAAPELVFPTDTNRNRTVRDVRRITVDVASPAAAEVPEGAVLVRSGHGAVTISATQLAALPQQTRNVTFLAAGTPQTHTETGPTLAAVLRAARVRRTPTTTVTASATDAYAAAVTPAEATSGGRTLLLSLAEDGAPPTRPRLVPDGDVAGGRYVSDVTTLDVGGTRCR